MESKSRNYLDEVYRSSKRSNAFIIALASLGFLSLLCVVGLVVARIFLFQPYTIPSAAMEPTLRPGDYVVVAKGTFFFHSPHRGDIVVFRLPRDGRTVYVKRLIGLPGDRVQMRDERPSINGQALGEQPRGLRMVKDRGRPETASLVEETNLGGVHYLTQIHPRNPEADNTGLYIVPPHCYFVLGDNRDNSADSRFDPGLPPQDPRLGGCGWDSRLDEALGGETGVGFVPEDNLIGKLAVVLNLGGAAGSGAGATPP